MVVDVPVTPVYVANKRAYDLHKYRVIGNQGSTRSSKTFSVSQLMIDICLNTKKHISVVSPSLPHLKKGARKDIIDVLERLRIFNENDFHRTDNVYRFPQTGSMIEFFGVEDSTKVRGPGRDILFCNEANLINHASYIQLALRTTETIFLDFNPADEYSWVYPVVDDPMNKLIVSTYRNNLANLSEWQIAEIEALKGVDENLWKVYGLGLRGTSSETIYTHWKECQELPRSGDRYYSIDFGFNVPTAVLEHRDYEDAVYVDELLYQTKLTTAQLVQEMKQLLINKTDPVYCDNAEPKTIQELCDAGYNALPADKDVTEGIRKVKATRLFITSRSTNLLKEIKSYKWKVDKDGIVLDEPVKFMDHACDALRYGIFTHHTSVRATWTSM